MPVPEVPIKGQVKELVDTVDADKDQAIAEQEKVSSQEIAKKAEKLKAIFDSGDEEKIEALDRAIRETAKEYENLTPEEIYQWVGIEKRPPLPSLSARMETEPGSRRFGKPPGKSEVKKAWDGLDAKQKKAVLLEARETAQLTPEQQRRLRQLELLVTGIRSLQKIIEKGAPNVLQKLKMRTISDIYLKGFPGNSQYFLDHIVPQLSALIAQQPDTSLVELMKQAKVSDEVLSAIANVPAPFVECKSEGEWLEQKLTLVKWLREIGDYEVARELCHEEMKVGFGNVLKENFRLNKQKIRIGDETKQVPVIQEKYNLAIIRIRGKLTVEQMTVQMRQEDPSLAPDIAEKKADQFIESLVYQDYLHMEHQAVMETIHDQGLASKWPKAKQELWQEYKDSMGIGTLDISDENWDMIINEIAINAPLIIVSGGVASLTRAGVSKGLSWGARTVLGAARVERIAAVSGRAVGTLASHGAGLALEGAVFEMTNAGLRGEWLFSSPEWAQRIMWSAVGLGVFKGAGKLGEALAGKEGMLKESMAKITNGYVRKGVEELLVKGHLEVAAILTLGAVQNGVYNGDLDKFFENFGEELFHAYITIGALKISGKGVEAMKTKKKFTYEIVPQEEGQTKTKAKVQPPLEPAIVAEEVPVKKLQKSKPPAPEPEAKKPEERREEKTEEKSVETPSELPLTEMEYEGYHFKTGQPVTFKYLHGTEPAKNFGEKYQQHIEVAGRYVIVNRNADTWKGPGFEVGEMTLKNPLVIAFNTRGFMHDYDATSWKAILTQKYGGKTGEALAAAVRADGYDGIVTVKTTPEGKADWVGEVVVLGEAPEKKAEKPAEPNPQFRKPPSPPLEELRPEEILAKHQQLKDGLLALDPRIPEANIENSLEKPIALRGLPDTEGKPTDAYFLPVLNAGGMGMVREIFYRAADGKVRKKLIKSPVQASDERYREMAEQSLHDEAANMTIVYNFGKHPNLAEVHLGKLTESSGESHLLLEKAGDMDGHDYIRHKPLSRTMAVSFISQVMNGLKAIHENGCIHRDLKWGNVMIDNATGQVRIIDWGTLSAQPNPKSEPLKDLLRRNEKEARIGLISTASIYAGTGTGSKLYHGLMPKGQFLPEYDYLAVFQMTREIAFGLQRRGVDIPPDHALGRMAAIAERGAKATEIEDLSKIYAELQSLASQLPPQ